MRTRLAPIRQLLLLTVMGAGLCACGNSGTAGQTTVIVRSAAAAAAPSVPATTAQTPPSAAAVVTTSATTTTPPTATNTATAVASAPAARAQTTVTPSLSAAAPAAAQAASASGKAKPLHPVTCLKEAGFTRVRVVRTGEWSGALHGGTVFVRGPYRNSAAAARAAHALAGVRGGDYAVYATRAGHLGALVSTVASCLGPGTTSYTF